MRVPQANHASGTDTDTDTDTDRIIAVIAADTESYLARNKAAWRDCFVHDGRFQSVMECGGLIVSRDFESFQSVVFDAMDADPGGSTGRFWHENIDVHVDGDTAWARFDQGMDTPVDTVDPPTLSYNLRILSREAGGWRIVFHGVWAEESRDTTDAAIEIDADARVEWLSPRAADRLPEFPGLTISHGTLRASRPDWDRDLRQAIGRASKLLSMVPYREVTGLTGDPVRYPVILGDDADGARLICWVRIEDFRLYVSIGDDNRLSRCLTTAEAVFDLSTAQTRLVRIIAEGHDLSVAADQLGITPHTARTHLRRIFDKVGVRSQTALLRMVLGTG